MSFFSEIFLQVSINGFLTFAETFSGNYNKNSFVTESIRLIAPLWTSRRGPLPCETSRVESRLVNSASDQGTFQDIIEAVQSSSKANADFNPTEALITTWFDIAENNSHTEVGGIDYWSFCKFAVIGITNFYIIVLSP